MDLQSRLEPVLAVAREHAAEVDRDARFPAEAIEALPTIRAQLAKMSIELTATRAYLDLAAARVTSPQEDTGLFVLRQRPLAASRTSAALRAQ